MAYDFSHQRLRGRSFKGQDLTGADFTGADVRGVDFSNAILIRANFKLIQTGLKPIGLLGLIIGLGALAGLAGFITAYAGAFAGSWLPTIESLSGRIFASAFALVLFVTFAFIMIRRGLGSALSAFAIVAIIALTILAALPGVDNTRLVAILLGMVIAINVAGVGVGAVAVAVAQILSSRLIRVIVELVALAFALLGVRAGTEELTEQWEFVSALAVAVPVVAVLIGLSFYVGWKAIAGEKRYELIRRIAIAMSCLGGTSFRGADLTDADFSNAMLKNSDFRGANLTRINWFNTKWLNQARIGNTYLEHPKIRQLLITKQGQAQNFDHLDLRGLNLDGANLANASLIGAKLSEATLQGADLTRAKLVQSHLYQANLTEACLTGAVIENWGIAADTRFDRVRCDFVFMQLPTETDPDPYRKPDNRNEVFQPGDFVDFVAPIVKTLNLYKTQHIDPRGIGQTFKSLDLYHHKGIDPRAAAISLKQLAEQHPEADIEVVALEGRGDEKVRVQAKVAGIADRSALSAKYFETYRELASLPYGDLQALLASIAEKDERICSLEKMVTTAIESNKFYVETYYDLGDTMTENRSININSGGGNVSGVVGELKEVQGGVNFGAISDSSNHSVVPREVPVEQPKRETVLAVIMFTDVTDSTQRMAMNQQMMIALLERDFQIMHEICDRYEGRVLKSMGDGLLMYFNSVVKAVACGQEIQRALIQNAACLPSQSVLHHRIGIHLGEVYFDGDDVLGMGVNVASRLQGKADPGGICISQTVYEVVKAHLPLDISPMGMQTLRGVPEALLVYKVAF